MSYWLRETLGWMLIGLGLIAFGFVYFNFLLQKRIVEAVILGFIGFTVFRGGMHLLKVAMAARAAREVRKELVSEQKLKSIRLPGADRNPGRQRPSVVPGAKR